MKQTIARAALVAATIAVIGTPAPAQVKNLWVGIIGATCGT
jgi:uncharacterized membrane protein